MTVKWMYYASSSATSPSTKVTKDGNVVGLEMLDASKKITEPESLEFALASGKSVPALIHEKPSEKYGK